MFVFAGMRAIRMRSVVALEDVLTEVAVEIAPDDVDVVGVVLGVVIFNDEGGALDTVVVLLPFLRAADPREFDVIDSGFAQFCQAFFREFGALNIC